MQTNNNKTTIKYQQLTKNAKEYTNIAYRDKKKNITSENKGKKPEKTQQN